MPEVFPAKINSFTTEDKAFPASNLLKKSSFSKWRSLSGGTKQEAVEFSFSEPIEFSRLDIGNNGSAFIEVLVRRSVSNEDPSVLLPSSSFMSPVDAKGETNLNRVRVFGVDQFTKSVSEQKWDVIKFVCSQPFNKTLQYGISFVSFHTPSTSDAGLDVVAQPQSVSSLESVLLNEEESQQFKPGYLFQSSRQSSNSENHSEIEPLKPVSITEKLLATKHSNTINNNSESNKGSAHLRSCIGSKESDFNSQSQVPSSSSSTKLHKRISPVRNSASNTGNKTNFSKNSNESTSKPLSGVIFTLSGYQNPLRSQLRDKAIKLGAKYKQDWDSNCTHLICAFPNTPKFNAVKGKGIIVSDKWIIRCYETKSNLPWRNYRVGQAPSPPTITPEEISNSDENEDVTTKSESSKRTSNQRLRFRKKSGNQDDDWEPDSVDDEEEDEEWADEEDECLSESAEEEDTDESDNDNKRSKKKSKTTKRKRNDGDVDKKIVKRSRKVNEVPDPEDEDTDDEIQRVMTQTNDNTSVPHNANETPDSLPDLFEDKHFFIHGQSIPLDEERLIGRLIVAFAGNLNQYMNPQVQYVITRSSWNSDFDDALTTNSNVVFVRPEWIFACDEQSKLVPFQKYQVVG